MATQVYPQATYYDNIVRMWKQRLVWMTCRELQGDNYLAEIEGSKLAEAVLKKYPNYFKSPTDVYNTAEELVPAYFSQSYSRSYCARNIGADYFSRRATFWRCVDQFGYFNFLGVIGTITAIITGILGVLLHGSAS